MVQLNVIKAGKWARSLLFPKNSEHGAQFFYSTSPEIFCKAGIFFSLGLVVFFSFYWAGNGVTPTPTSPITSPCGKPC